MQLKRGGLHIDNALYSSISHDAKLYPVQADGSVGTVINAQINASPDPNKGTITFLLPDGEKMHGAMSLSKTRPSGFGEIYRSLDSKIDEKGKEVTSGNGSPGTAELIGSNGTQIDCEYYHRPGPHGAGVCRSSRGQLYKFAY